MGIIAPLLKAIHKKGYEECTDIQMRSIPIILKGNDLIGCAQTGTGKTAAFGIPLLQLLGLEGVRQIEPRALILVPTRELAIQIGEALKDFSDVLSIRQLVIYGGVSQQKQVEVLRKGVDVIIATPGRLLDLYRQGHVNLKKINKLVLDEADNMLDMGFVHDIRKLLKAIPSGRQSLMFSATMPTQIRKLANEIMKSPVEINVSPVSSTVDKISQTVYFVEKKEKVALLTKFLNLEKDLQTLIFMRTKHGADKLAKDLSKKGLQVLCIHGNKSQNARQRALNSFKNREVDVLLATDIAARGIDISELPRVINFDLPEDSETYVHRIGRTGRAGKVGKALSFCSTEEKPLLLKIQKLIGFQLKVG